nr:hypothetical protein BDOA9_0163530 [Bradyrhizobium sp. DOA9]
MKRMREGPFRAYQNGNSQRRSLCTATCLVARWNLGRFVAVLLLGKPSGDIGRGYEPPGKLGIEGAREDRESFIKFCTREQLSLGLCGKRLRLTGGSLPQKQAPLPDFEGDVPSRNHDQSSNATSSSLLVVGTPGARLIQIKLLACSDLRSAGTPARVRSVDEHCSSAGGARRLFSRSARLRHTLALQLHWSRLHKSAVIALIAAARPSCVDGPPRRARNAEAEPAWTISPPIA